MARERDEDVDGGAAGARHGETELGVETVFRRRLEALRLTEEILTISSRTFGSVTCCHAIARTFYEAWSGRVLGGGGRARSGMRPGGRVTGGSIAAPWVIHC